MFAVPKYLHRSAAHRRLKHVLKIAEMHTVAAKRNAIGADLDLGHLTAFDDAKVGHAGDLGDTQLHALGLCLKRGTSSPYNFTAI